MEEVGEEGLGGGEVVAGVVGGDGGVIGEGKPAGGVVVEKANAEVVFVAVEDEV